MKIDGIENGIVLDHIKQGKGMLVYKHLNLHDLDASVALLQNCKSNKMGRKDMVKIGALIDIDLDVLGYIDPSITVTFIENGEKIAKKHVDLPETLTNIIHCKNPRCITSIEQEIPHEFKLIDRSRRMYHCVYCDTLVKAEEIE